MVIQFLEETNAKRISYNDLFYNSYCYPKAMPKNVQSTTQLHLSHMLAKWCSKFSKLGFNSMWTKNLQTFKPDLEKAEELEIKFPTSIGCSYILRSGPLAVLDDFFFFSYLFLATHYGTQDLSSPTRNEPVPLQWKCRVLTTGPSGKTFDGFF